MPSRNDTPPLHEIRIRLWNWSAITVAWDGVPLPIEPFAPRGGGVSLPALYQLFMYLAAGAPPFGRFFFGAILNALSERLVVSTMHDDHRYRVVFAKGMVVTLLQRKTVKPAANPLEPIGSHFGLTQRLSAAVR
jgi:hypothetical protein